MNKEFYLRMRSKKMNSGEYVPLVAQSHELDEIVKKYENMGYKIEILNKQGLTKAVWGEVCKQENMTM